MTLAQWLPKLTATPITESRFGSAKKNPFSQQFQEEPAGDEPFMGKNTPFSSPRFLGYKGSQPIFGGARLNVCC